MDEGYLGVLGVKELSMEPGGGFEDTSVGSNISKIDSYKPWEGNMGRKKGQGSIVPIEEIIWWDFAGKGSRWLKNNEKNKKLPRPGIEPESPRPQLSVLTIRPPKQLLPL